MTGPRPDGEDTRGRGRRAVMAERSLPAPPAVEGPWIERHASHLRWTTWIAIALIVMRLVAPRPDGWRRWNDATAALQDVETARNAALMYYQAASLQWPAPSRFGQAPQGMLPYLPGGVSFGRARYHLAWEYAADSSSGARVIGISVVGDDPLLALAMARRAPAGTPFVVSGGRFSVLIATASGR